MHDERRPVVSAGLERAGTYLGRIAGIGDCEEIVVDPRQSAAQFEKNGGDGVDFAEVQFELVDFARFAFGFDDVD